MSKHITQKQSQYLADLVNARYTEEDPARELWRDRYRALTCNADVSSMIEDLVQVPTLHERAKAEVPSEDGYYRNPETGQLYRLKYDPKIYGLQVSIYSKTGGLRRLSVEGNLVKGKWDVKAGFASRSILARGVIKKSWKLTLDELTEFAYGFCPYHGGPLTDGVSVALGYGKVCAAKEGRVWSEEAAQEILAAQQRTLAEVSA